MTRSRRGSSWVPSSPVLIPDLHWTLVVCGYTLFVHRDEFPARRTAVPVKVAAALFEVSENTIYNWETLKTDPPEEYPGRDIGLSAFELNAEQYRIRFHNKRQVVKNRTEGKKKLKPKAQWHLPKSSLLASPPSTKNHEYPIIIQSVDANSQSQTSQ